jgi:anti-sigma factor RsiW
MVRKTGRHMAIDEQVIEDLVAKVSSEASPALADEVRAVLEEAAEEVMELEAMAEEVEE